MWWFTKKCRSTHKTISYHPMRWFHNLVDRRILESSHEMMSFRLMRCNEIISRDDTISSFRTIRFRLMRRFLLTISWDVYWYSHETVTEHLLRRWYINYVLIREMIIYIGFHFVWSRCVRVRPQANSVCVAMVPERLVESEVEWEVNHLPITNHKMLSSRIARHRCAGRRSAPLMRWYNFVSTTRWFN